MAWLGIACGKRNTHSHLNGRTWSCINNSPNKSTWFEWSGPIPILLNGFCYRLSATDRLATQFFDLRNPELNLIDSWTSVFLRKKGRPKSGQLKYAGKSAQEFGIELKITFRKVVVISMNEHLNTKWNRKRLIKVHVHKMQSSTAAQYSSNRTQQSTVALQSIRLWH